MALKLSIKKLKNIVQLEFELPGPGAYLLTGSNGAGKTSLLTCLSRIGNGGAFQKGFRSSSHPALDSHGFATISYERNGQAVAYSYVGVRWTPSPRRNSNLLALSGYADVRYIAADSDRVEPQREEFAPRKVRLTDQWLRDSMNRIFDTTRFNELCYINLHRGGRTKAYLVRQTTGTRSTYYSERNFSLGELCVLKLLLALKDISPGSLLLIDELELALHPRAQSRLFSLLSDLAAEKNLTIIFSTHSVSLIKTTDRRKVLFLVDEGGVIKCLRNCYPTFALGQITAGEEVAPDCLIYVEDDSAKKCVEAMIDFYRIQMRGTVALPTVLAVALGGYREILNFLDRSPQMLPQTTKVVCLLDQDVQTESIADFEARNDHPMLALVARLRNRVGFLPWTPEVGFRELMIQNRNQHELALRTYFADNRISIPANWPAANLANATPRQLRDSAKAALFQLTERLSTLTGRPFDRIREGLFDYLVQQTAAANNIVTLVARTIHS